MYHNVSSNTVLPVPPSLHFLSIDTQVTHVLVELILNLLLPQCLQLLCQLYNIYAGNCTISKLAIVPYPLWKLYNIYPLCSIYSICNLYLKYNVKLIILCCTLTRTVHNTIFGNYSSSRVTWNHLKLYLIVYKILPCHAS